MPLSDLRYGWKESSEEKWRWSWGRGGGTHHWHTSLDQSF